MMPMNLKDIDAAAWEQLEEAATEPNSGFRYLNFCSVDGQGSPQARIVVLRRADRLTRVIEFYTDMRSPKWLQISAHPRVTVVGYCKQTRLQLRLQGTVELHASGSDLGEARWNSLPYHTQRTYLGGPPGDELLFDAADGPVVPQSADDARGKAHFGVILLQVRVLDWFQLRRDQNQRALLTYINQGTPAVAQWINP